MTTSSTSTTAIPTLRQQVRELADGRRTALQLCDEAIARIRRDDGALNAVVVRDFERAREQARAADAALARGERRPLLGVPMTVKESFNVAGLVTSWGLPPFKDFRAASDSVMVQRLKAAGAVILGKTNVAQGLGDWQSNNPNYGRTVNPFDATRSAGGSSGGAAAALAAGYVALELGSDIAGSIRVPAAFCGVYGHKPTHGLLPVRGHDFPNHVGAPDPMAVVGPLASTADDLALALEVLAGPDETDAAAYRLDLPAACRPSPAGLRVLLLRTHPSAQTERAVAGAVDRAGAALAAAGAEVSTATPLLPDLAAVYTTFERALFTVVMRGPSAPADVISAHAWFDLLDRRVRMQAEWRALFEAFDVIVCPAFGCVAYPHVDGPQQGRTLRIDGVTTPYHEQFAWPSIASWLGLPATAASVGRDADGLPLGVQIIGRAFADRTTIAVAGWLAKSIDKTPG